jgi:hypothetical protein
MYDTNNDCRFDFRDLAEILQVWLIDCNLDPVEDFCTPQDLDNDGFYAPDDCNDYDPDINPGATELCDGIDNDCDTAIDEGFPDSDGDGTADCVDPDYLSVVSQQIQAARDLPDGGGYTAPVTGALVTYIKPVIGDEPAGFFIQAEQTGPALFVAIDPAGLVEPGDRVAFVIQEMSTERQMRCATVIAGLSISSSNNSTAIIVQNVSDAADLVSAVSDYESELITVDGLLEGDMGFAGSGFFQAQMATNAINGDSNLSLRVSDTVQSTLNLVPGCTFTVDATPLWRFYNKVQISAWQLQDIAATCP